MPLFHIHKFSEQERHFAPPSTQVFYKNMVGPPDLLRHIIYGMTTIISKCSECGILSKLEVAGDARKTQS